MKRLTLIAAVCFSSVFLFSGCEVIYAILVADVDNCERYSIYHSSFFGSDLLWEETACDSDCYGIEERFNVKRDYYEGIYSSTSVYTEHVTYSQ